MIIAGERRGGAAVPEVLGLLVIAAVSVGGALWAADMGTTPGVA